MESFFELPEAGGGCEMSEANPFGVGLVHPSSRRERQEGDCPRVDVSVRLLRAPKCKAGCLLSFSQGQQTKRTHTKERKKQRIQGAEDSCGVGGLHCALGISD